VSGLMGWTSLLGGEIRHSEIRGDAIDSRIGAASEAETGAGIRPRR
jgi:hypothetical protein